MPQFYGLYGLAGMLLFPVVFLLATWLSLRVWRIRPGVLAMLIGLVVLVVGAKTHAISGFEKYGVTLIFNSMTDIYLGVLLCLAGYDGRLLSVLDKEA